MAGKIQRATIRDIAKTAQVSIATVSRFMNKSGYVDVETAQRIAKVIEQTDYMPSIAARSLKSQKSRIVLLVVPDICNPFYSSLAKCAQQLLADRKYVMTLYDSNESTEEINAISMAKQMYASGILFGSIDIKEDIIRTLTETDIHVVGLNAFNEYPFDTVHVKGNDGTYLAMRHLIMLGHRNIGFAGGTPDSMIGTSRRTGYERGLLEAELQFDPRNMLELGFSQEDGYEIGKYFLTLKPLPTAICCANDQIALGLINALSEAGLDVPRMVSVTGMDNIPYARNSNPSLTTVTNDSEAFAREGIRMLFERIDGQYFGGPRDIAISHELIPRMSTGIPRSSQ